VLTPLDLAVSKLARFAEPDRADIEALARARLVTVEQIRKRADEALGGYVGRVNDARISLDIACRLIEQAQLARRPPKR
jgi:hypothetical protein